WPATPLTSKGFSTTCCGIDTRIVIHRLENMQSAGQTADQKPWQWKPGQSGNPAGKMSAAERRARLDAMVNDWGAELGGKVGTAERMLLRRAAELSLVRPHRNEDHVRTVNAVSRLLAQAGFRKDRKRPKPDTGFGEVFGKD